MIRHYLKLIWNRRRSNLLITIEIFFSFLVVFGVVAMAAYYGNNYRRPLGFTIDDVWVVNIDAKLQGLPGNQPNPQGIIETGRQLRLAVVEFPEVRALASCFTVPYGNSRWMSTSKVGGREIAYSMDGVTDGFAEVFGLTLVQGRWFNRDDDAAGWDPVVVNEHLAADVFDTVNPVGRTFPQDKPSPGEKQKEWRVVGVIREFRQDGELALPENYLMIRVRLDDVESALSLGRLPIKVRPGTTAAFEERLVKRMQEVARDWSFEVEPAIDMREQKLRDTLTPLIAAGVIAGFLMLMVALGLTGVVWQSVTQRTREIGLRRAKGATIPDIRTQVMGELAVMATIAVLLGAAIVVQFPLLKLVGNVTAGVYAASLVISSLSIYLLTLASAWYPSRMATSVPPAEALHYE
jgi:putative ABC transport system permease protein